MIILKKIIALFITIISIFSFYISFNKYDINEYNKTLNIENNIAEPFVIPEIDILSDPKFIYEVLSDIAKQLGANIYRNQVITDKNENDEIYKYVFFSNKSNYYDDISITGNMFTYQNMHKLNNSFISSIKTNDINQVGTINDFANNDNIFIKPLLMSYKQLPAHGKYYVELPENVDLNEFITTLNDYISNNLDISLSNKDFISELEYSNYEKVTNSYLTIASIIIIIISIIIIIYIIIVNTKKISIYKLNGSKDIKIFNILILKPTILSFVFITILMLMICYFLKLPNYFYIYLIKQQLFYFTLFFILSFLPYYVISKTNLNLNIKNKVNSKVLIFINISLKILFTLSIISIFTNILVNYDDIKYNMSTLKNWEKNQNYGSFYPYYKGTDSSEKDSIHTDVVASSDLYKILNDMGSIFIDASIYSKPYEEYKGFKSVIVNSNYLNEFPIYDINNTLVSIPENERDFILLVPNKYKNRVSEIKDFFSNLREKAYEWELESFSGQLPDHIKNQDLKIIFIKDNQDIFSFNPDVSKNNHNILRGEIVEVITTSNSVPGDRWGILGGGNTDPLKVKLIDNNPEKTYIKLLPKLKELELDDNFPYLVSTNELISKNIHDLKYNQSILILIFTVLLLCFSIIAIQNVIIFFNSYKQKIVVRRIFGLNFINTYKEFTFIFSLTWGIQFMISILSAKEFNKSIIFTCICFCLIEFIISSIYILFIENKNKINTLKGE